MSALERQGYIVPEQPPRFRTENPPIAPREVPSFPSTGLIEPQPHTSGFAVRQPEQRPVAPRVPQVDSYQYLAKLVKRGTLTPEQGIEIMGQPDAQRVQIVSQIQEQERQEEAMLRAEGVYDQVSRLTEIQREIPSTIIPIENGAKYYASYDSNRKHPYREWRSPDELKPMALKENLLHVATMPKALLLGDKYPLVDVIFVTNADGTQIRYIDRAQTAPGMQPEPGVYKEVYGEADVWGRRKLLSRELVGDNIMQTGWDTSTSGEEPKPVYGIATEKYNELIREQLDLQSEIMEIREQKILDQVDFGGTDYVPTKKYRKQEKFVKDTVDNLLWAQKDTPKDKAIFAAQSFISNSVFYLLYQDYLPTATPAMQALSVGTYNVGNQLLLFNWKDVARYTVDHPVAMGLKLAVPVAFWLIPSVAKIPAMVTFVVGQAALGPAIKKYNESKEFKKFAQEHPEITDKKELKEKFEHPEMLQKRALDRFAQEHQEWYDQLKKLNPNVPDIVVKQAMTLKARSYQIGVMEIQQILKKVAGETGNAGLLKYFVVPLLVSAPLNFMLAQTGLSPLVDHLFSAMALSAFSTGASMTYLNKTMGKVKKDLVEDHPELIPELRRKNTRLERLQKKNSS